MKNANIIAGVLLVVGLGVGFFGGMQYQKSQTPARQSASGQARQGAGRFGATGAGAANRPVSGDIISADEKSITVKLTDGSSKIVLISGTTTINKATQATASDLTVGAKVAVFGMANSDGSITAANIQLNPMQRMNSGQNGQGGPAMMQSPQPQQGY